MLKILSFLLTFCFSLKVFAADHVILDVYESLSKDYINEIDQKTIMLKGLKALTALDPDLKGSVVGEKLYFYVGRKVSKIFELPDLNADNQKWAAFSEEIIAHAAKVSSKVELLDFEMPDRFAKAVFNGLDGYSHYYGQFEDNTPKILKRNYAERMIDDVLLIKILNFHQDVSVKVQKAVEDCSKCRGFILDLRGNHGGLLDEAIKIADIFLDEGIIVYTSERGGKNPKYYTALAGDFARHRPLVILIDGFTASAAEVLAAALSEQNRAVLIGTKSFGKGTVQDVVKFQANRTMALTSAFFFTPSGMKIDQNGLNPAICTGNINSIENLSDADCARADRLYHEVEVEVAVKFIKNDFRQN